MEEKDIPLDMRERFRRWKQNTLKVESAQVFPQRCQSNSSHQQMGCGGDMKDDRDNQAWNQEFRNNPIYRGYR